SSLFGLLVAAPTLTAHDCTTPHPRYPQRRIHWMSPDLCATAGSWPLVLVTTCLACVGAALGARALPVPHQTLEALAIGIVLAVLVDLVPRLTGNAAVGLALLVRAIDAPDLRGQLAANGPVVIQNVATALLFGAFMVSLRFKLRSHRDLELDAVLWFGALALAALADG